MLESKIYICSNFAGILPEFAEICRNSKSRRIRTHPDASGIGTSSAEICIWPIDPLLASSSARPPAGRSPRHRLHVRARLLVMALYPRAHGVVLALEQLPLGLGVFPVLLHRGPKLVKRVPLLPRAETLRRPVVLQPRAGPSGRARRANPRCTARSARSSGRRSRWPGPKE